MEWLARNAPHCRVYNNANISTSNGTFQALTFNTERYDVGGMHSTSSNTGRITVPTGGDGVYRCGGHVDWVSNGTGIREVQIRLNGATVIAYNTMNPLSGTDSILSVNTEYALVAGDYLELLTFQSSGGALNIGAGSAFSPEFYASWAYL